MEKIITFLELNIIKKKSLLLLITNGLMEMENVNIIIDYIWYLHYIRCRKEGVIPPLFDCKTVLYGRNYYFFFV